MNDTVSAAYRERFRRVLDHIQRHLDESVTLDGLSRVAGFSKFHFHRQFSALFGLSVFRYVQMLRLRRASYLLAFRTDARVIDIALVSGFESGEAFARAFRKTFGQTPSNFRKTPEWEPWRHELRQLQHVRAGEMNTNEVELPIEIVDFNGTKVAVLEHHGSPDDLYGSIRRFIEWRKENGVSPRTSDTYNIVYNDPDAVPAEDYRIDICASVKSDVRDNPYGVTTKVIPAGRCAVIRHTGPDEGLRRTFDRLYGKWLPESGEELRDFPCFFHRVTLFPDVDEHDMVTDIYLPLK